MFGARFNNDTFAGTGRVTLLIAAIAATVLTIGVTGYELLRAKLAEDRATHAMLEVTALLGEMSDAGTVVIDGFSQEVNAPGSVDLARVGAARAVLNDAMNRLGGFADGDAEQARLFAEADAARKRYLELEDQAFAMLQAGDPGAANAFMQQPEYFQALGALSTSFDALMTGMQDGTRAAYEESWEGELMAMIAAGVGIAVILVLWTAIVIDWMRQTRQARRLHRIAEQATARLAELNDDLELRVAERTAELEEARIRAEAANQAKSDFLGTMSHELRTPLNGVLGMATVLGHTALDEKQKGMLGVIEASGHTLLALMNDILDFARLENGSVEIAREPFPADEALERALRKHRADAEAKGLDLACEFTPAARQVLIGDENRLRQLTGNLLANAIKFTEQGGVTLSADYADGRLHVSIADTGCGVAPDIAEAIFDRFSQGDNSVRRRHGGAGLGLALARELVSAMDGRIGVRSAPGEGAEFWFELPMALWTPAARPGDQPGEQPGEQGEQDTRAA